MSEIMEKIDAWLAKIDADIVSETDSEEKHYLWSKANFVRINKDGYMKHKIAEGITPHFCIQCGAPEFADYFEPTKSRLISNQTCFNCNFWDEAVEKRTADHVVAKHHSYYDCGRKNVAPHARHVLGFGGSELSIRMLDGSREWTTNNMWTQGYIPRRWHERMPDNAEIKWL